MAKMQIILQYYFQNKRLVIIILIALFLRLFLLSSLPSGFFCDEASNGYDAYSIMKTMHDQHGQFLPLFLRAFNDDRESLYVFITVPFIKVFGLNEFSTRLPAALLGTLTVVSLYYLAEELFNQRIGLLAALLMAISPWHIQFSRIAFRAIILPLLFCLGLIFFSKSFKRPSLLILSSALFGLSLHTYAAARGFIPLFVLGLVIFYRKELWQIKKHGVIAAFLFLTVFVFLLTFWISPEGMSRANAVGITKEPIKLFHDYMSYFSPDFLFINGDLNVRHSPTRIGQLHFVEFITVAAGTLFLLKENARHKKILLLWLVLYPFPAFLTAPSHAIRSILGVPLFSILSAHGFYMLKELTRLPTKMYFMIAKALLTLSMLFFINRYFFSYPTYSRVPWQYGMGEAIAYAEDYSYDCVFISPRINQAYIFPLFYTQFSPLQYQASLTSSSGSLNSIGKYRIELPLNEEDIVADRCLLIVTPEDKESLNTRVFNLYEVYSINYLKGSSYIKLFEISADHNDMSPKSILENSNRTT